MAQLSMKPAQHRSGLQPSGQVRLHRGEFVIVAAKKQAAKEQPQTVTYGNDWYEQTRKLGVSKRTVREELEYRRKANAAANNGKERKDLYTENWDGSEYKGSPWNILTLVGSLFVLVPVGGLAFAYFTYGVLWG